MNGQDVHDNLDQVIQGLKDKTMDCETARQISNAIGKKIVLWGIQFKVAQFTKEGFKSKSLLGSKEK